MLQRIAGFTLLPLFIVGFVETHPVAGVEQHFRLGGEHAAHGGLVRFLLDFDLLGQWHLSRLNYDASYYHHCVET